MVARTSIYVEGFSHKNPIPAACRIGDLLFSGSIQGTAMVTKRMKPMIMFLAKSSWISKKSLWSATWRMIRFMESSGQEVLKGASGTPA